MNKTAQKLCVHSSLLYVIFVVLGCLILPGWLPPPSPALPGPETAAMFQNNIALRIGMVVMIGASMFMFGLPAVVSAQMRRMEGKNHVLADIQFATVIIAAITVLLAGMFWTAMAWRPNVAQDVIVAFNDLGWFIIVSNGPPVIVQELVIGICILMNRDKAVYPRWVGYANLWMAALTVPALGSFFFKTGPLAWDGFIGFWIPVPLYFVGWLIMYFMTLRAIDSETE